MEPEPPNGILTGYTIYSRRVKNDRNENVNPIITVSNITNQTFLLLSGLGKNRICNYFLHLYKPIYIVKK